MKLKTFKTAGLIAGLAGSLVFSPAFSQSNSSDSGSAFAPQGQEPVENTNEDPTGLKVDPAAEKLNAETAELNSALLGVWVLTGLVTEELSEQAILAAAQRCLKRPDFKSLEFEPGAVRKFPDVNSLFGDLVYFRTEAGLQRMDMTKGQVTLIREFRKRDISDDRVVWVLRGRAIRVRIRFSVPNPNRSAEFMLEEGGLYLRCGRPSRALLSNQPPGTTTDPETNTTTAPATSQP